MYKRQILDEPTRGIDVGAKYEIYTIIADLAKQGKSIIMISSEMPELIGMSDRIMAVSYTHLLVYSNPMMVVLFCAGLIALAALGILIYYRFQLKTRMMRLQLETVSYTHLRSFSGLRIHPKN